MLIIRRENRIPAEKTHLQKCLRRKVCREFREGQNLHNYYFADWLNASFAQPLVKVRCFVKDKQEPWARGRGVTGSYLIVRRSASLPRFDERFVNYGYNKVQQIEHLRAAGFEFFILNNAFVMDMPHPDSTFRRDYVDGIRGDALRMRSVFASFLSAINDKYANRYRFPICTKVLDSYYVPLE